MATNFQCDYTFLRWALSYEKKTYHSPNTIHAFIIRLIMLIGLLYKISLKEIQTTIKNIKTLEENIFYKHVDVFSRYLLQRSCPKTAQMQSTRNIDVCICAIFYFFLTIPENVLGEQYFFKIRSAYVFLIWSSERPKFRKMPKLGLLNSHFSDERLFSIMSVDSAEPMIRVLAVRPPLDRLVSVYKDFFEENEVAGNVSNSEILKSENKGHYEKEETFERWIKKDVLESNPEHGHLNRHMMEYDQLCAPCFFNYDYIVHLYTFEEDVKFIFQVAGITEDMDFKDKFPQSVNSEKTKYEEYFTNLPKDILRGIYLKYRQDFFLFGFEIPDILKEFHTQSWLD
ncbi:unnamed protein product, partial [Meganyctiphanes norvegica]